MRMLLTSVIVLALLAPATMAADLEGFARTYEGAQKAATASGKPMYLHFTTTWCGWCRKIEKDVYGTAEGRKALSAFVPASLDCTVPDGAKPTGEAKANLELMRKYGVSGYPSLVILTPEGDLLHSWAGYVPIEQFQKELNVGLANYKEYKGFLAYAAKADKTKYEYNSKAMAMYVKLMRWDAAGEAARAIRKLDAGNKKGEAANASYVLVRAALADKKAEDVKSALADVKKFDPANAKGLLEQAYWEAGIDALNSGDIARGIGLLVELTNTAKKLSTGQNIYATMAVAYAKQGKLDDADKAMTKAIDADPSSPIVERLKTIQKHIRDAKPQAK